MSDQNLDALVNLMIPGDSDRNLPCGSDVDLKVILEMENKLQTVVLLAERFSEIAHEKLSKSLAQLSVGEFDEICRSFRTQIEPIFKVIGPLLLRAYYTDPKVQDALGIGKAPPFPNGRSVYAGNLELLEPVYNRGLVYRNIHG